MFFDIPEGLKGIGYYQGVSLILWYIAISLMILSSVLFAIKGIKIKENKGLRMTLLAFSIFFLFFSFSRIAYLVAVYNPQNYDFFVILGYIFTFIGILPWVYVLELYAIKFTKKKFTVIYVIGFVILIISLTGVLTKTFVQIFYYIFGWFAIIVIIIIYLYLIINTTGFSRKKALGVLIGFILFIIANQLDSEIVVTTFQTFPLEIAPIIMILGVITFTSSQLTFKSQ